MPDVYITVSGTIFFSSGKNEPISGVLFEGESKRYPLKGFEAGLFLEPTQEGMKWDTTGFGRDKILILVNGEQKIDLNGIAPNSKDTIEASYEGFGHMKGEFLKSSL